VKYPLTLRGTLGLIGGAYLFLGPASNQADLIAAIIGSTIVSIIILIAAINFYFWSKIKKKLTGSLSASGNLIESSRPERFVITLSPLQLLPLMELRANINWVQKKLRTTTHSIAGRELGERKLVEDLTFPHRGNWEIEGLKCSIRDIFGLVSLDWIAPLSSSSVRVAPGESYSKYIPVLSTSERAGDHVEQHTARTGDPYDLKAYHPSDGMKRIVWKLFAKSGELYSRLEEFAMTPEGRVTCMIVAGPEDDQLCNWTLGYLREMESLSLELFVGAAGMTNSADVVATNSQTALDLMIDTVWQSPWISSTSKDPLIKSLLTDAEATVEAASTSGSRLSRLIIFVSGESIASAAQVEALTELGCYLEKLGVQPIFCCQEITGVIPSEPKLKTVIKRSLFDDSAIKNTTANRENFPNFLKVCANSQWHVII
jgi:hypothetical protein